MRTNRDHFTCPHCEFKFQSALAYNRHLDIQVDGYTHKRVCLTPEDAGLRPNDEMIFEVGKHRQDADIEEDCKRAAWQLARQFDEIMRIYSQCNRTTVIRLFLTDIREQI